MSTLREAWLAVTLCLLAMALLISGLGAWIIASAPRGLSLVLVGLGLALFTLGVRLWVRAESILREQQLSRKSLACVLEAPRRREPLKFHRRLE